MMSNCLIAFSVVAFAAAILSDLWRRSRGMSVLILCYIALLAGLGSAGVFAAHSHEFPDLSVKVMNGFLALLCLSLFFPDIRRIWLSIPTERIALWHWVRLPVGIAFLVLANSGVLPPLFGFIAGTGDVLIGLWAVAYVFIPILRKPLATSIWNAAAFGATFGSLILAAMTLALSITVYHSTAETEVMDKFPLIFVFGFGVPMLVLSNFIVFRQVRLAVAGCCRNRSFARRHHPAPSAL